MRLVLLSLVLSPLLLACGGQYQSVSSGQVGCPPNEIEISDKSVGWSLTTWTATCRGTQFFCTAHSSGGGSEVAVTTQVECRPEVEESVASTAPASSSSSTRKKQHAETASLPKEAAGFSFSMSRAEAEAACEVKAGKEWGLSGARYTCTGAAKEIGMPVTTQLAFCQGTLCDLTLLAELSADEKGDGHFEAIYGALRKSYGKPQLNHYVIPGSCSEHVVECLGAGKASWQAEWTWASGERLVAKTLRSSGTVQLAVRYILGRENDPGQSEVDKDSGVDTSAF